MADFLSSIFAQSHQRLASSSLLRRMPLALGAVVAIVAADCATNAVLAQSRRGGQPMRFNGDISQLPPEVQERIRSRGMGGRMTNSQRESPRRGEQPSGREKASERGEDDKREEGAVKTIKRSTEKSTADVAELNAAPDQDGMVQFNFRGQPWPDVLEWFAGVSKQSLDWQELPADTVNLSTQRRYTIAETRDLLNRALLARGFTLISLGDVLTAVKIDKLDPSLIPRIEPDDLDDHSPHDFARTRFPLPATMEPAKAVEDLKVVLSPAAKVTPLLASGQVQVIDAVTNLRDVRDLLYAEQMVADQDVRPRAFGPFKYRRADYIADQVMVVLGLDPSARMGPMEMHLEQQRMQLAMQMQQQGKDISKMIKQEGPKVHIAVDKRRNFLLVNAPPAEMDIIERTIEQFDVPEGASGDGLADGQLAFRRHSTVSISPDEVVNALQEMGGLNPLTQLQHDNRSKTIFALATDADHATIESLIDKLDGTGRRLKVIWLSRRAQADQVAGTIKALMVGEQDQDDIGSRSRYWSPWDYGQDDDASADFRIQADVENNRLLLWANDDEYQEVNALLKELGAVAAGNPSKLRIFEPRSPEETAELLKRIRQTWSGDNQLNINVAPRSAEPVAPPAAERPVAEPPPTNDKITLGQGRAVRSPSPSFAFAAVGADEPRGSISAQPGEEAAGEPSPVAAAPGASQPINVTVAPDGRVIISSEDVAALDQLEELLAALDPPKKDFEVFKLYNSRASMVSLNLEEYFADELSEDDEPFSWWRNEDQSGDDSATLGKPRKLRFIYDTDTNTIVAQNASPAQLETMRELIKIYDQPLSEESVTKRRTDIVPIRYSRAQDIAAAIKEVYRDLLSSKDKEFQGRGREGEDRGRSQSSYSFWGGSSSQKSTPMKMSFEGALSIGVDEVSNSLIISADDQIWENVRDLAVSLDEKARPDTVVQVHELRGSLKAADLQAVLNTALSQPWPGGKPLTGAAVRNGNRDQGEENGDRGRNWGRYRGGDRRGRG